jgi:2-keto-3-deoxy-L-rhamnonate aldolase RhmA
MVDTAFKAMTTHSRLKVGTFLVEFNTPGIGQILKASGCDFVLVDMEHSGFSISDIKAILRYMQAADLAVLVRPPSKEYHHAARVLDIGASGVMFPMVGSPEEVKRLLNYIKYPPKGGRGVALQIAHDRYAAGPVMKKLSDANRHTAFCALIETEEGVENAEAIAAMKDVDLMWIGHFDLSADMGIAGQFDHPRFKAAIKKIVAACKKHDKSLGRLVPDANVGKALFKQGFDFICHSGDVWMLQATMQAGADQLRASCKGGRKRKKGR